MNHVRFRMYGRKKLDGVWNVDYSERIHRIYKVHSGNGFCEANKKGYLFEKVIFISSPKWQTPGYLQILHSQ